MKKVLISLCLILISTVCAACYHKEQLKSENLVLISDIKEFENPQEIIEYLSGMESELDNFISQNKGLEENSKVFGMYMKNASFQIDKFMKVTDFNENGNFQTIDTDKLNSHFINPRVNNIYISYTSGINVGFDYNYILKKYGPYLNETWNTYIKYNLESDNEIENILYEDFSVDNYKKFKNIQKKWILKWSEFIKIHPDFPLTEEIKQKIKRHENKLNE